MSKRKKVFRLDGLDYYRKHLEVLNTLLPVKLTDKEIDIISILLDRDISDIEDDLLSTDIRRRLRETLNLSHANISTRLKKLEEKGFIRKTVVNKKEKKVLRNFLFPDPSGRTNYEIIIKDNGRV